MRRYSEWWSWLTEARFQPRWLLLAGRLPGQPAPPARAARPAAPRADVFPRAYPFPMASRHAAADIRWAGIGVILEDAVAVAIAVAIVGSAQLQLLLGVLDAGRAVRRCRRLVGNDLPQPQHRANAHQRNHDARRPALLLLSLIPLRRAALLYISRGHLF